MTGDWKRIGMENEEKSFGELPTLGRTEEAESAGTPRQGPSWSSLGLSEAETLKPPEGIVDDGRTDEARKWKSGEIILNRYVVERELGQGGMGVVYECLDRVGGVKVAVKGLPPELGHDRVEMEEVRENFQLVVGLRHPNIAGVRTLEKDERGEYFLVMDVAEGEPLRRWMRRKARERGQGTGNRGMPLEEAIPILRQVASALDYAHRMRVIHRDVKPGNVMVDVKGEAKVLDFGLAAQIRTSMSRVSREAVRTSGTRPYMAPEQWEGQPQDARTDQYALGVTAYELLAGRLPFEGADTEVLRTAVLHGRVRDIEGVPPAPMAALRRALAKDPKDRFGTCGEFVGALTGERAPQLPTTTQRKGCGRDGAYENVFLRKVRLGKDLEVAGKEKVTPEEQTALAGIQEVFAAGEEALRVRDKVAASELFVQVDRNLAVWRQGVEVRLEKERQEEEARQKKERQEAEARRQRELAEEKRLKRRERKEEEVRRKRERAEERRSKEEEQQRRKEEAEAQRQKEQAESEQRRKVEERGRLRLEEKARNRQAEELRVWMQREETEQALLVQRWEKLKEQLRQAGNLELTQEEQAALSGIQSSFDEQDRDWFDGLNEGEWFTETEEAFERWRKERETRLANERQAREAHQRLMQEVEKWQPTRHPWRKSWYVLAVLVLVRLGRVMISARKNGIDLWKDGIDIWKDGIGNTFSDPAGILFWGVAVASWGLIFWLLSKKKKK